MTLALTDIVGQDPAVGMLQRCLASGRLHHGLLLAGPRGVGRRTTAEALAATLLCARPRRSPNAGRVSTLSDDAELYAACGRCDDCRMLSAGAHPDYQMVRKELAAYHPETSVRNRTMQELGIEVIRHFLIAPAGRGASRGRGKVFVVAEAELMSIAAQNALLKTLEEPPPGVTILLLTTKPDRLLPTTLSRCARVNFGPLPAEFVAARLAERGVEAGEAGFWGRFTNGSIGRSVELSEAGLYEIKRELVDRLADADLSEVDLGEHLAGVMDAMATASVNASKRAEGPTLSKTLASRRSAGVLLELLAALVRDAMARAVGSEARAVHGDQPRAVDALAGRLAPSESAAIIEQLSLAETLLWRNVNPKTLWDNVAITLRSARPLLTDGVGR